MIGHLNQLIYSKIILKAKI